MAYQVGIKEHNMIESVFTDITKAIQGDGYVLYPLFSTVTGKWIGYIREDNEERNDN